MTSAKRVFDKLKNLLGNERPPSDEEAVTPPPRPGAPTGQPAAPSAPPSTALGARRPARPRAARSDPGLPGGRPRSASGAFEPLDAPAGEAAPHSEIPCPNCGEPMLTGWGTTCGKCRPNLVGAKTMFFAPGQVELPAQAAGGMTLGWLIVIGTGDESKRGALIELDADAVLSRADAPPTGAAKLVPFDDGFMSSGHAVLSRPLTGERTDAFTIRDRDRPGPSANGTFVNSHKLVKGEIVRLADGDIIKVGTTELLFKSLWLPPVGVRNS
ncbi:MAG TPA: FHA domain-containing protein [Polyangia bacterium]|nr:FHA domain-containing protein [Polyangia bacterium]